MKIVVISDTHSLPIPGQLIKEIKTADLLIHTGDFCSLTDFQSFKKLKEIKAVFGNMDDAKLRAVLPEKEIFFVEGIKIGLYHGSGSPKMVLDSVKAKFKLDKVDVVIFGHSHMALKEEIKGVLYFNPGSPNDMSAAYCSYGLLEISEKKLSAKIVKVEI